MHGIVYVPESEAPTDPLEVEGALVIDLKSIEIWLHIAGGSYIKHQGEKYYPWQLANGFIL